MVGVIAPASPVNPETLKKGLAYIKSIGFEPVVCLDPSADYGRHNHLFSSASVSDRNISLSELFRDPKIKAILSVRGAYGSMELLPTFDLEIVSKYPKIFVGFSDVTALLLTFHKFSRLVSIHGPSLVTYGAQAHNNTQVIESLSKLIKLITGEILNPFEGKVFENIGSKEPAQGVLIGGNLTILSALMGTPWEPSFDNCILFFEESGEAPYRIHRALLQFKLAGKLDRLKGVLIGDLIPPKSNSNNGPTYKDVLNNIFSGCGYPVLSGVPIGHGDLNYPIPIGVNARIIDNKLEISEAAIIE